MNTIERQAEHIARLETVVVAARDFITAYDQHRAAPRTDWRQADETNARQASRIGPLRDALAALDQGCV